MGRAESHRALLDHQLRAGAGGSCNLEDPLMNSVVVGLGKTGASCIRYLVKRGDRVSATDSRRTPPGLAELGVLAASRYWVMWNCSRVRCRPPSSASPAPMAKAPLPLWWRAWRAPRDARS